MHGDLGVTQGGRSWQPFGEGKNGHKNYRQAVFDPKKTLLFAQCLPKRAKITTNLREAAKYYFCHPAATYAYKLPK